jgi:uncharacterized protein YciI
MQFIYKLKLISRLYDENSWTDEDERIVTDHFIRLEEFMKRGIVILAGRTSDVISGFGIVIFNASSIEEAKSFMELDPAIKHGIMNGELFEYKIALFKEENII